MGGLLGILSKPSVSFQFGGAEVYGAIL